MRDLTEPYTPHETQGLGPLSVQNLTLCRGGRPVLSAVNLDLNATGCTAILGANGAGKTQLLHVLHGLSVPDKGVATWGGMPAQNVTAHHSLVFQKPVLLRRSVAANLDFVLKSRGLDLSTRDGLLAEVGLSHLASHPARSLSGGEAQRLALARALATRPKVLLLDEPTANLDPASCKAIEDIVNAACAKGVKIIMVTHDTGQARRLADDIVFLHHGSVAEHSPAQEFFTHPQSGPAKDFINGRLTL